VFVPTLPVAFSGRPRDRRSARERGFGQRRPVTNPLDTAAGVRIMAA
jgi:hypothetical protein